ncbi:hypothetical protein RJ640_003730 [Escallonia rubra]|uniref:Fe2OG dioxygenase domain-containing protein n=1 Tax=Escallonia rubra TaxID=112253 RepID=A0AA88UVP1_9ASTE|nr:hypothetical protein RJ640_002152 [Escallonia rubra]KAK2995938.1 hypothetical protein RJ640_003730 [Escallonia rubra]
MANSSIATVDLSPFFIDGNEDGKKAAMEVISRACSEYGFFQIVNHGIPNDLILRAFELSKKFFSCPVEEKLKFGPELGAPVPAGYNNLDGNKEYLLICAPGTSFNVLPTNPLEFQRTLEELFICYAKTGQLVEGIINDCLGLPRNILKANNNDRRGDILFAFDYPPAETEAVEFGTPEHQDISCFTFVCQYDVAGLEVRKDGVWIGLNPTEGALVVNVGDVIQVIQAPLVTFISSYTRLMYLLMLNVYDPKNYFQVLSNNKFKSAFHRVVRPKGKHRYSSVFFYNLHGDKWVEPLPQFTSEIGKLPKYRGFLHKDYLELRLRQRIQPPLTPEERIRVTHYAIPS